MVYLFFLYYISPLIFLRFRRYGRACKDKLSVIFTLVNLISHRIPKLRSNLPFIY